MRLFTTEVFNQTIQGTGEVFSDNELDEVLGRADILSIEVEVTQAGSSSDALTVKILTSNSGRNFVVHSTPWSGEVLSAVPFTWVRQAGTEAMPLGKLIRLSFSMAGAAETAAVRCIITGRSW